MSAPEGVGAVKRRHFFRSFFITLVVIALFALTSLSPRIESPLPHASASVTAALTSAVERSAAAAAAQPSGPADTAASGGQTARGSGNVAALPSTIDVRQPPSGFVPAKGDGVTDDSHALQVMESALAGRGGGELYFPAGTYLAHGLVQDSAVSFHGQGQTVSTLKHDQPNAGMPLLSGRTWSGTRMGSIRTGSTSLTVNDASHVVVGSIVAVKGAGGPDTAQSTTLAAPVDASTNVLKVTSTKGSAVFSESRYLDLGGEIVSYAGVDDTAKTFTGVQRGLLGTGAASHPSGTIAAQSLRLVAKVTAISGRVLTLDHAAAQTVNAAPVIVGSTNLAISDLTLDGGATGGSATDVAWPAYYALAQGVTITRTTIQNGVNGGLRLDVGTQGASIVHDVFRNNGGTPSAPAGTSAHVWIFRGSSGNTVSYNTMSGLIRCGVCVDDRTNHSTEFDGPSDQNVIVGNTIGTLTSGSSPSSGIVVIGSDGNIAANNTVSGPSVQPNTLGVIVGNGAQGLEPRDSSSNWIGVNQISNMQVGIRTGGSGVDNVFANNVIFSVKTPCDKHDPGAVFSGNGSGCPDST